MTSLRLSSNSNDEYDTLDVKLNDMSEVNDQQPTDDPWAAWRAWRQREDSRIAKLRVERANDEKRGAWMLLPCFDDEDDGVPPFCKATLCPLSKDNHILNNSLIWKLLGPIGFPFFDRNRKVFLGAASILTVFTMLLTLWGCFALSTDTSIVQRTYWAAGRGNIVNATTGTTTPFAVYVGLNSFVYTECEFIPGYMNYGPSCNLQPINFNNFNHDAAKSGAISYKEVYCGSSPLPASFCKACQDATGVIWFSAVTNCAGLILALLGAQTRMRYIADIPVQKLLGMGADTVGVLSLVVALLQFDHTCLTNLKAAIHDNNISSGGAWEGPGFYCYIACVFCGVVRALIHYVTPLPGMGAHTSCVKGCCACCQSSSQSTSDGPYNESSINSHSINPTAESGKTPRGGDRLL